MKRGKRILCALLLLALLPGTAGAASTGNTSAGFAVWPLLPDNQIDAEAPYFYLDIQPGKEQTLTIQLSNSYDHDIRLALEANTAYSSGSGLIAYSKSEHRDPSLTVDFSTLVMIPEPVITVPANGREAAELLIRMPDEPFEGEILGGIIVSKLPDEDLAPSSSTMITNVYTYAIAVRIRQDDTAMEPEPEVLGVSEGAQAGGPTLVIDIRNAKPMIIKGITLDVSIRSGDTGETLLGFTAEKLDMAPNSVMPYTKPLPAEEKLAPGSYQVRSTLTCGDKTWEFLSPLEIEAP